MDAIRDELYRAARLGNNHRMRQTNDCESPGERPDLLFSLPEISDTRDFIVEEDKDDITLCQQLMCNSSSLQVLHCTPEFSDLANIIMHKKDLHIPNSPDGARDLYIASIDNIEKLQT